MIHGNWLLCNPSEGAPLLGTSDTLCLEIRGSSPSTDNYYSLDDDGHGGLLRHTGFDAQGSISATTNSGPDSVPGGPQVLIFASSFADNDTPISLRLSDDRNTLEIAPTSGASGTTSVYVRVERLVWIPETEPAGAREGLAGCAKHEVNIVGPGGFPLQSLARLSQATRGSRQDFS